MFDFSGRRFRTSSIGVVGSLITIACAGQKADGNFRPSVTTPSITGGVAPTVCIDEAHYNAHTASGLYRPFARLLQADGYTAVALDERLGEGVPQKCSVLVIVNPAGGKTYKVFGLNLPTKSRERRPDPAFSSAEIDTVRTWVERGGSLLLVADHPPFGSSASTLSTAFGVNMSAGFTEAANTDPAGRDPSQLLYSRENHLLADHPVTNGRSARERISRIITYTGQSLLASSGTALLLLGDSAVDHVAGSEGFTATPAGGRAQGIALETGKGRVVVLGEAAMLTAQVDDKGNRFGMQQPGNDNAQFTLNVVHWLTRLL